jgi:hypothetical protein
VSTKIFRFANLFSENSLETTEIYLHTAGAKTVASPLDTASAKIIPLRRTA